MPMKEATLVNFTGFPVCNFKLIFLNCLENVYR